MYNKGLIYFLTGIPHLCQLPIFGHRDGTATIFLESRSQGFYAVLIHALDNARHCMLLGLLPRFVWGEHSMYFDPQAGPNVWEYFFKQPSSLPLLYGSTPTTTLIKSQGFIPVPYLFRMPYFIEECSQDNVYYTICCQLVKHFYTDLMLPGIIEPTQDICLDGCIGIQLRSRSLRDLKGRGISDHVVYETYHKLIDQILDQSEVRSGKIFLATDSELVVDKFKEMFPGQIIVSSSTRYKTTEGFVSDDETSGYQKGIEVIQDVELLRRCAWLIHCHGSSMSHFLQFLSPNQSRIDVHKYLPR